MAIKTFDDIDINSLPFLSPASTEEKELVLSTKKTIEDTIITTEKYIKDSALDILTKGGVFLKTIQNFVANQTTAATNYINETGNEITKQNEEAGTNTQQTFSNSFLNNLLNVVDGTARDYVTNFLGDILSSLDNSGIENSELGQAFKSAISILKTSLTNYQDGVTETTFGAYMNKSWQGNSMQSFLDYFQNVNKTGGSSYKINILGSTPLDSNTGRDALFGSMILGTPYLFNQVSDPNNRAFVNTLVKDCSIVSFTPGLPKYFGSHYIQDKKNNILNQTESPESMLTYLLRNGIDKTFSEKDKRYYTFEAKYKEYFSYLEAMLNPIWIKMGLANTGDSSTFNIFSFFNIKSGEKDGSIDASKYDSLKEQYNSSIGFYANLTGAISESVSNSKSNFGSEYAGRVNSASDDYARLNFLTGMGTGGAARNLSRTGGIGKLFAQNISSYIGENFTMMHRLSGAVDRIDGLKTLPRVLLKGAAGVTGAALDVARLSTTEDFGSLLQSYATTNGMKIVYPELWESSDYSKNININFSFVSPYGDPLSIFRYVYVPFCALLCLALPRQADANGFVSPFFVRADAPGVFTSDLALISDITWTKGGSNNLWTKDGLPRAIDCTVTVTDLYPYLAMTKRMSYLSANPSYTVFLDNMAGLCKLNTGADEDGLNEYFKTLINRINGEEVNGNILWNKFNSSKQTAIYNFGNSSKGSISNNLDTIPWLHNSSLN